MLGNLKHYIQKISSGDSFFTVKMKLNFVISLIGIFEIIVAILFYVNNILPLLIFYIALALYCLIVVPNMLNRGNYGVAMVSSIFLVVVNSFTATLCTGFNTGFSLYLFAAIAACFYMSFVIDTLQKKELIPILFSVFLMLCYLFNFIMMKFVTPLYELKSPSWYSAFSLLNSLISFIMVILFNILFLWEIKARNTLLSNKNVQLDEMAHKDPLTHLLNRRSMNEHLQRSIETLKITGKRFCLILCDIDNFKHVNDTYGHDAGDAVLVSVSNIISSTVRESDIVCRWGGEEILILVSDPIETASICAERIRRRLEENVTSFGGNDICVTMTFGISESIPGYKIEQLIQQADDKLYRGKHEGKNRVVV